MFPAALFDAKQRSFSRWTCARKNVDANPTRRTGGGTAVWVRRRLAFANGGGVQAITRGGSIAFKYVALAVRTRDADAVVGGKGTTWTTAVYVWRRSCASGAGRTST